MLKLFGHLNALAHGAKSRHPDVAVLDHDCRETVTMLKKIMDKLDMPLRRPKIHELLMLAADVLRFGNSFGSSTCMSCMVRWLRITCICQSVSQPAMCVCCCADKGEADHARSSKGAFKASSKRSVGAEAENLRYTTRREILTHSVRSTVHLRFDSYFHCLCASGLVPMCVQRVQAAVVKDVVSAPVKSKSVHGGDVLLEKLSPYVRRVLPAALAAFLDKVVVTPEDGEKRDRAQIVQWYDKYDVAVPGRRRFRLTDLLPFAEHAAEEQSYMGTETGGYTRRPPKFNNVWLSPAPENANALLQSGEIYAAVRVQVAERKYVDCFIVMYHMPTSRARGDVKVGRPRLEGEAPTGLRQRAALYGGECGLYPVDAYHEDIPADIVVLSNTVAVVPVSAVRRRADIVPVLCERQDDVYPEHKTEGKRMVGAIVSEVNRPLLLRAYPRLAAKRLLDQ